MSKIYEIKNDFKIAMVAKAITASRGTGSGSMLKIETVLREFKELSGIKNLHNLNHDNIKNFYQYLQESGQSNSNISNKVSYFGEVLAYAGKNEFKQTAKQLDVSRRNDIYTYKGNSVKDIKTVQDYFKGIDKTEFTGLYHAQKLQEVAGLRMVESGGIKLLEKNIRDIEKGILAINGKNDLSKNDRDRVVYLTKDEAKAVLEAREFLKENNLKDIAASLTDSKITSWTAFAWRQLETLKKSGIIDSGYHNHGNRHSWANLKYETLWREKTGQDLESTAKSGLFGKEWISYVSMKTGFAQNEIKKIDGEIRQIVSQQLGHERISITSAYLGKKA